MYVDVKREKGDEAVYRALPGVSSSMLRSLYQYGPTMCRAMLAVDTPAMALGRLVHAMVLTPDRVPYAVYPGAVRRGREWEAWAAEHASETIVTRAEWDEAARLADALRACPEAMAALDGEREVAITGVHAETGTPVKGRLDCLGKVAISDLKTTRRGDLDAWTREAAASGVVIQAAMYAELAQSLTGCDHAVRYIVVDKRPPHPVGIYYIDRDDLRRGAGLADRLLRQWAELERTGWPNGYGVQRACLPDWAFDGAEPTAPEARPDTHNLAADDDPLAIF